MRCHQAGVLRRCLLAAVVLVLFGSCGETAGGQYATLPEAEARGAMDRGWVPRLLPPNATRIREAHDLDTNETWGTFDFTGGDETWVRGRLSEVNPDALAGRVVRAPERLGWWPTALRGTLQKDALQGTGLSFYQATEEKRVIIAIDSAEGRAFYWRPPA